MIKKADVIVDLQAGDTGKGKVAHALAKKPDEYDYVMRYNGGGNAGHTIYHNGEKYVTHFIPVGVLYGIKSIIGLGCVVNPDKLIQEINELELAGFKVRENLLIDKRVHIITEQHLHEDSLDSKIGTTKTGNGPAYRDKYYRKGLRAVDVPILADMVVDTYGLFNGQDDCSILCEGAQGFELDIDWGDYPYVTSSHCTIGGAILNGIPAQKIDRVYGVAKAYRTYVGAKNFEGADPLFVKIREVGNEFGATTGRPRQVDWLDLDDMIKAININGVTDLIINKSDVLQEIGVYNLYLNKQIKSFDNVSDFIMFIEKIITTNCLSIEKITFSTTPYDI